MQSRSIQGRIDLRRALPFVLGGAAGVVLAVFVSLVRTMGVRIPQLHIEADYLAGVTWAAVLGLSILIWPVPFRDKPRLLVLWAAKVFVTLCFMLLYEWRYGLDAYYYFSSSLTSAFPRDALAWNNGTDNLTVLAWLHSALLPDSFHAMKVSFAMVGLLGVYVFYRAGVRLAGEESPWMLYALGLFPSILFWSSTLGKDSIQFLGMALYAFGVIGLQRTGRFRYAVPLLAGIVIASYIRFWMAPILVAPLLVLLFVRTRGAGRAVLLAASGLGVLAAVRWVVGIRGLGSAANLYLLAQAVTRGWEGGSSPDQVVEFSSFGGMLAYMPWGAFSALFRPLPGEVMNPFGLLAGLEDLVLLGLLMMALLRIRRWPLREPLVAWGLAVVLFWSSFYAFLSPNNFGAGVRFKLQILPFLLALLWFLSRDRSEAGLDPTPHPNR